MLFLILYGGPDQLMPLTSGLAAIFAFLLIFWNKFLGLLGKLLRVFRKKKRVSVAGESAENKAHADVIR